MTKTALGLCIFLSLCAFAKGADLCPDLSGQYVIQGEDGQVRVTITQKGCEEIRIDRTANYHGKTTTEQHNLKIDGKFQGDTPWLGGSDRVQTSAKFISAALEIVVRPLSARTDTEFSARFLYVLRSSGDLDIREFDRKSDSYVPAVMAVRQQ
jgi:hypothetical protein